MRREGDGIKKEREREIDITKRKIFCKEVVGNDKQRERICFEQGRGKGGNIRKNQEKENSEMTATSKQNSIQ